MFVYIFIPKIFRYLFLAMSLSEISSQKIVQKYGENLSHNNVHHGWMDKEDVKYTHTHTHTHTHNGILLSH